eukprot:488093_1
MNLLSLLLSSVYLLNTGANYTADQWIKVDSSTLRLPRKDSRMAVGVWNGSIFILGGISNRNALVEWNIFENTMTDYGATYLNAYIWGNSQYWSQQQDILYMIGGDPQYSGDTFSIFNLRTKQLTENYHNISIPIGVDEYGCLASYGELLYVIGGWNNFDALDIVQIVNVTSNQWISGGATMQTKRRSLACIVHDSGALFAIGGFGSLYLKSVEKLMVKNNTNSNNQSWKYIDDLLYSADKVRAISFGDDILVIGGHSNEYPGDYLDVIQVIDTESGHISFGGNMNFAGYGSAVINVNNIVYSFGGYNAVLGGYQWNWEYYELLSTNAPSHSPSDYPSYPTSNVQFNTTLYSTSNTKDASNTLTLMITIIITLCLFCVIIIFSLMFYIKKLKNKAITNNNEHEGAEGIFGDKVEIHTEMQRNEKEGNFQKTMQNDDDLIIHEADVNDRDRDGDIVEMINKTDINHENNDIEDDDVIQAINQTKIGQNNKYEDEGNDDIDIVKAINQTAIQQI